MVTLKEKIPLSFLQIGLSLIEVNFKLAVCRGSKSSLCRADLLTLQPANSPPKCSLQTKCLLSKVQEHEKEEKKILIPFGLIALSGK